MVATVRLAGPRRLAHATPASVSTRAPTVMEATLRGAALTLTSRPPLKLQAMFPLAPLAARGASWSFASARLELDLASEGRGLDLASVVREACTRFVTGALGGTPVARPGYAPLADRDLGGTVRAVAARFSGKRAQAAAWLGRWSEGEACLRITLADGFTAGEVRAGALLCEVRGLAGDLLWGRLGEISVRGALEVTAGGVTTTLSHVRVRGGAVQVVPSALLAGAPLPALEAALGAALREVVAAHPRPAGVDLAALLGITTGSPA